ncbi:MAG: hypothetical protein ACI4UN_06780 [Muribaculaceae bacterium]
MVTQIRIPSRSKLGITLAVLALAAAIAYIVMPYDYDGPLYGIIDDFCFFMAAFCFAQSQFISPLKVSARSLLKRISLFFLFIGIAALSVLAIIAAI